MLKFYVTMQSMFIAGADRLKGENEKGATATEYALLVAFIAVAIIGGVSAFGGELDKFFTGLGKAINITP